MSSAVKPLYSVTGSIETDEFTAYVMLDKKNHSIHIHFHGDTFDKSQKSILEKHSNNKFPEVEGAELAKQVVIGEFPNKKVQVIRVTAVSEKPEESAKIAQRTIIRFKK